MSKSNEQRAYEQLVFEESCADVDMGAVHRLEELLDRVQKEERDWWHKEWHQATGIPCDGMSDYCPLRRRNDR